MKYMVEKYPGQYDRNLAIALMITEGKNYKDAARAHNISIGRCQHIVWKLVSLCHGQKCNTEYESVPRTDIGQKPKIIAANPEIFRTSFTNVTNWLKSR